MKAAVVVMMQSKAMGFAFEGDLAERSPRRSRSGHEVRSGRSRQRNAMEDAGKLAASVGKIEEGGHGVGLDSSTRAPECPDHGVDESGKDLARRRWRCPDASTRKKMGWRCQQSEGDGVGGWIGGGRR